jgi:diguanylate cyclase (GGDEF)-like protein
MDKNHKTGLEHTPQVPQVLVVDDEDDIRHSLCEIIKEAGYEVLDASSGEEALEILEAQPVDVVVTDIRMPGLSGLELTGIVKEKYSGDVIIITGYGGEFSYEEAWNKGASDFAQKPIRSKELIARLKRVCKERALVAERKEMERRLLELTITDDLTKLFNSRHFFQQIQSEINRASRYNHPLSLLLIDVDNFKYYNDTYGHLEGDKMLSRFGEVIQGCMRKNDSAYRYGGDEFTVILPETRGKEAIKVAERIREEISGIDDGPCDREKKEPIAVSVGIAEYRQGEKWEELTKRADEAMYRAKRSGGGRELLL